MTSTRQKTKQKKEGVNIFRSIIQTILPIVAGCVGFYLLREFLRTMPVHYKEGMVTTNKLHMVDLLTAIPCLFLVFALKEALKYSIKIGFLTTGFICFIAAFQFDLFSDALRFAGLVFCILAAGIHFFETFRKNKVKHHE